MVNIISPFIPTEKWSISTPIFAESWKDDTSKKVVPGPGAQTTLVVLWIHLIFLLMLRWTWLKVRAQKGPQPTINLIHSHVMFECFLIWKKC